MYVCVSRLNEGRHAHRHTHAHSNKPVRICEAAFKLQAAHACADFWPFEWWGGGGLLWWQRTS